MRVVIIGAGLIGVSTAYFLAEKGVEVVVLDRQPGPGLETSFANGGMITPSQADPWNSPGILRKLIRWIGREDAPVLLRPAVVLPLWRWGFQFLRNSTEAKFRVNLVRNARLAAYSVRTLGELRARLGLHYEDARRGTMRLYRDGGSLRSALDLNAKLEGSGVRWQALDPAQVVALEPALGAVESLLAGGIFYPDDESGDAHLYCRLLAHHAMQRGAIFRHGVTVLGLESSEREIRAVRTSAGRVEADVYVLAAGSYSPVIARSIRLAIPVQPVKGYSLTLDIRGWDAPPRMPVVDEDAHIAATPLGHRLRVAGTAEFNGFDASVDPRRIRNMSRFISDFYPGLRPFIATTATSTWAGLRPYSCDGVPILGATNWANLFLNTGHGHLGWSMAAGSGRLVTQLICGEPPDLDPAPYGLGRFQRL
ncbi:MAG: D-amino acid dehydrogenase [Gammaproteobacteria bacterium]|nr:D-amino acid dehydrogenase [Gammaproteobacteria bacterium]